MMEFDEAHRQESSVNEGRRPRTELLVTLRFKGKAGRSRAA